MDFSFTEPDGDSERTVRFLRHFAANQPQLFGYILSLVPNWNEAEEILQETSVRLWKSFDQFEEGTNFKAWARKTAFHQVLSYRKKKKRTPLPMSEEFVDCVTQETEEMAGYLDDQLQALSHCVEKLKPKERDLVNRCYQPGVATKEVAEQLGWPAGTVYKALTRIRRALYECIERRIAMEGS